MRAVDVLRAKRDGKELSEEQIDAFVSAATHGIWEDYQLSAMLMAIWLKGMTPAETAHLTRAMADSGKRLDLTDIPGTKIDKHSTGGVGDKTSLILAPLAAACGVVVPMMSGRGLGHTGGTLDKLAAIPGFRTNLSEKEFRTALEKVGVGMIGQTQDVAPADKKLYALRDVTATVESVPLITASILSKKIAEGISGLVMDVKCGPGAFMKVRADARALAESLVRVGTANGLRVEAMLTAMDAPLGRAVGNAVEVAECIETLKGRGPADVEDLSVRLAATMVRLAGLAADDAAAEAKVQAALVSGAGLEKFREIVAQQGGDPRVIDDPTRLPTGPKTLLVPAPRPGFLTAVYAGSVGVAAMVLGAGRERAADPIDHGVGILLRANHGEPVRAGDTVFEVRYRDEGNSGTHYPFSNKDSQSGTRAAGRPARTGDHPMSVTDPLLTAATAARNKGVAPYSNFKVGAAVESLDGSIISGCNVENASYGLTICAERVALFKAVSEGVRKFSRIAVVTDTPTLTAPCGACRQVIWELAGDVEVVMRNLSGEMATVRMSELLPYPFEAGQLPTKT